MPVCDPGSTAKIVTSTIKIEKPIPFEDIKNVLVITAADEKFSRTLWQFLRCVERRKLTATYRWLVYDLGLLDNTRQKLQRRFQWCTFKPFPYSDYPPHVHVSCANYAWKPILIADEAARWHGAVFWFDCATLFRTSLTEAISTAHSQGIWYLRGQTPLHQHTDKRTLDAMAVPLEVRHLAECVTGALGFDTASSIAQNILADWKNSALMQHVVAPSGASLVNHKFDQALFSGLIFKAVFEEKIPLSQIEIDISSKNPVRSFSSRNKVRNRIPTWADPAARSYYSLYKFLDRKWLKWRNWLDVKLGGLSRHMKEHFKVTIVDKKTGLNRTIPSPHYGYYADPFVWQRNDKTWVLLEEFECSKDKGRLVALELASDFSILQKTILTTTNLYSAFDCHASFPFVFEEAGEIYMIPETCGRLSIDLYKCRVWPGIWSLERRLVFGIDAADTMVVKHKELWWLLTSVRDLENNRHLEIYSTRDIFSDELVPHPQIALRQFAKEKHGTGRNAGFLESQSDGSVMRFMQTSHDYYGQGGSLKSTVEFDENKFQEQEARKNIEGIPQNSLRKSHHMSKFGELIAFDQRTRTPPVLKLKSLR